MHLCSEHRSNILLNRVQYTLLHSVIVHVNTVQKSTHLTVDRPGVTSSRQSSTGTVFAAAFTHFPAHWTHANGNVVNEQSGHVIILCRSSSQLRTRAGRTENALRREPVFPSRSTRTEWSRITKQVHAARLRATLADSRYSHAERPASTAERRLLRSGRCC